MVDGCCCIAICCGGGGGIAFVYCAAGAGACGGGVNMCMDVRVVSNLIGD